MNIAILASGQGSTFSYLYHNRKQHGATIKFLMTDRDCYAFTEAMNLGIPCYHKVKNSNDIFRICRNEHIDLVCLAGWLRKLTIPDDFVNKVINVHPSLLPKFGGKGMYGMNVHKAVLEAQETKTGCTIHYVNNEYDTGPIIAQRELMILPEWTVNDIAAHIQRIEKRLYVEVLGDMIKKALDCVEGTQSNAGTRRSTP